jgi:phage-related protein
MASKPTVTLTLAGDEGKLTQAFDRVGQSSESMADKVDSSSSKMADSAGGLDSLGEATDSSEQKFQGLADTITGTGDIMTGFREGDIVGMATGFADLAGGLTEFVVPAMKATAAFMAGPLRAAMTFISAHPLLITLGILIALFVTLWTTSETFRNIVIGVFNAVDSFIKSVFGGAINWLVGAWNAIPAFFSGIGNAIGKALGNIGGFFESAFKGAANLAIGAVNWMIDQINKLITGVNHINPFDDIPHIPKLKRMHTGGTVPGMPGEETMMILQAGETVSTSSQGGGGGAGLRFMGNTDTALAQLIMNMIRLGKIRVV